MPSVADYCTDQFLHLRYPNGAGGKFLLASLMLFDTVAHWSPAVQLGEITYLNWFESVWPDDTTTWVIHEPNQPWQLDFYSRRFDRNNHRDSAWFNQQVSANASAYFHQCWHKGLVILDHWHKHTVPIFLSNSQWAEIRLPRRCLDVYQNLVKKKLFFHDIDRNIIVSAMDHPEYAWNQRTRKNAQHFNNQYEHKNIHDYETWFHNYLLQQHWVKPFLDAEPNKQCVVSIEFDQLLSTEGYLDVMQKFETVFNQNLDRDLLVKVHQIWCSKSMLIPVT